MKKITAILLSLLLLLSVLSGCKNTTDDYPDEEANPASDFEYEINSNQTGILINKYVGSSEHVIIPSHIDNLPVLSIKGVPDEQYPTAIAEGAFEGKNIQTVVIPETIKLIGYKCFKDCQSLNSITIASNSSLTNINGSAFENCTQIDEINFSSTQVKEIGSLAFRGCTNLKNITFSNTLEKIQEKAFYECSALLELNFPESLTEIEDGAFGYCTSLKKIEIPTKLDLTSLSEPIFYNVPNMEKVVFKDGRKTITGYSFIITDANVELVIPESVNVFSPMPFGFNPPANITIAFWGNAPEIVEDKDLAWLEDTIVRYNPETIGWEEFAWKDKCEMQPSSQN